ncbi:hypothetical protein [Nocardioides zhouii]|uniref:Uncharacterized protein n=1 Tax=Nocardioides zhouii TaxID=1168729 RepID=A0A4Q2SL25_9ACTN|nr:hypothetical protein [Nocardioides zhouii]RYC05873.1 hypothetical protein EUA94_16595 [Nocardioides zhouii]
MSNDDLSPMPTPTTEDPELYPGGVDAIADDPEDNGLGRDLDPDDNPAVDDVLPEGISEPDDKPQAPEGDADDAEAGTTSDDEGGPDAGQTAEDGSAEPPA